MAYPSVKNYANLSPITGLTFAPTGAIFHGPRVNQGPARAGWKYAFFLTGTSTPQNVYQDANLTTPFAPTGVVTADGFGRFAPIYLDNSVAYKVQLQNAASVVQQTRDPYNPAMATSGSAQYTYTATAAPSGGAYVGGNLTVNFAQPTASTYAVVLSTGQVILGCTFTNGSAAFTTPSTVITGTPNTTIVVMPSGLFVNSQGEIILIEASAGGAGTELILNSPTSGGPALKIQGSVQGLAYLIADNTVTTGVNTATFQAANRPGNELQLSVTATVAPAGAGYVGGTLTAAFTGITANNYTIVLSTGQVILGCQFTNGSTAFVTPSTTITGTPSATFIVTFSTGVAGWLPIQADGVTYYTPIFHGNQFTPYKSLGAVYNGQTISAQGFTFNPNGTLTLVGGGASATPATYFSPPQAGIGANTWFSPTVTGNSGNAGLTFINNITAGTGTNLAGVFTNIGTGLNVGANGNATLTGTYQLSTSAGGTPVVASGTITLSGGPGGQSPSGQWGTGGVTFNTDGTLTHVGTPKTGDITCPANYFLPTTTNIGNSLFLYVDVTQGTGFGNYNIANATWLPLTSAITIYQVGGPSPGNAKYFISTSASFAGQIASGFLDLGGNGDGTGAQSCPQSFLNDQGVGNGVLGFTLNANGTTSPTNSGFFSSENWYSPTTAAVGGNFWVKFTVLSNTGGLTVNGTTGTFLNLGSARTISVNSNAGINAPAVIQCLFSNSSGGTPILSEIHINIYGH